MTVNQIYDFMLWEIPHNKDFIVENLFLHKLISVWFFSREIIVKRLSTRKPAYKQKINIYIFFHIHSDFCCSFLVMAHTYRLECSSNE